jgi:hypothetical protein
VTDLFDIDDELNQRHQSVIHSNESDDEDGEYSKASRNNPSLVINRQISTIIDWNGAKPKNEGGKNKNNYIIEQWDEESEDLDLMLMGK